LAAPSRFPASCDVAIVGAGAAGLAAAIFTRRRNAQRSVVLLEGQRKPGAKILISGGSRCNVTNKIVSEHDFWGGRSTVVRRVLRAFPVEDTVQFFRDIGVPLHVEPGGKLFPDSNRARDVLDALLREADRVGVTLVCGLRVLDISASGGGFHVTTSSGTLRSERVVLATGGQSLPKTGSDGAGFLFARRLGHSVVPTTPGLVPLVLDETDAEPLHRQLTGVAQDVELTVWIEGAVAIRLLGPLLWTHFGASGPAAMNASRHWLRAQLNGQPVSITVNFLPGRSFDAVDRQWAVLSGGRTGTTLQHALSTMVPASVAAALVARLGLNGRQPLAHLARHDRRRLVHALVAWPLAVVGTRGYNYAEVTAGGVTLTEIDPGTMQSRKCPGLYLVGEILDVDGRIGGFNFQWAWSSAHVAGEALGR
jgi:predicted Rossmann fold flavoprotein